MENSNDIFSLLQLLPQEKVMSLIKEWEVDKNVRSFSTLKMIYVFVLQQLAHLESLREMEKVFQVPRSTLSDALSKRSCGFFEELCVLALEEIMKLHSGSE